MSVIKRLYEWLYVRVGGKPWTDIIREDSKKAPLAYMLIFLFLGIMLVLLVGWPWWQILVGGLVGLLAGHFWW